MLLIVIIIKHVKKTIQYVELHNNSRKCPQFVVFRASMLLEIATEKLYFTNDYGLLLLLSSVSLICRVSTLIFLRQTMSLGSTVLQLF